jgi:hypothetical protein
VLEVFPLLSRFLIIAAVCAAEEEDDEDDEDDDDDLVVEVNFDSVVAVFGNNFFMIDSIGIE